jgi:hypothetical protein
VLCDPEAVVAHCLAGDREFDRFVQGLGARTTLSDGRLFDDAE